MRKDTVKVISNTAITLDGKVSAARGRFVPFGTVHDRRLMHQLRLLCDAVLVGGNTFRNDGQPSFPNPEVLGQVVARVPIWNVIATHNPASIPTAGLVREKRVRPLIVSDARAPTGFPIETLYAETVTAAWIVAELEKKGVESLLIEGGGPWVYHFLKEGLLDEIYVTLCPKVLGMSAAPAIVDGEGFDGERLQGLSLSDCHAVGDEVYLRYMVV